MTKPSDRTAVRALLGELLRMADDDLRTATADTELAVAHGWFVRCVDSLHAALLLHDQRMGSVADPLLRVAMEHAVGITWLCRLGHDALLAIGRSHKRWAKNVQKATTAANEEQRKPEREDWSPALDTVFEEIAAQEFPEGSVDGEWKIDKRGSSYLRWV